mgnify:CR=1 FL=1
MASVSTDMRAAVRWRMPVSLVASDGSGLRWKFARRICVRSPSMTMAPSILESSNRRFEVKDILSGKPSLPAARTFSVSPTQIRAPRCPAMIMSRAVRMGWPGAVRRIACSMRFCTSFLSKASLPSHTLHSRFTVSHESVTIPHRETRCLQNVRMPRATGRTVW